MDFNDEIVGSLRALLAARLPDSVTGRLIAKGLRDLGPASITRDFIIVSLVEEVYSKIWMATDLIGLTGTPTPLAVTFTGPRIQVAAGEDWIAPHL
jgi:hypothetical protein